MNKGLKKALNIIVLIIITLLVLYFSLKDNFKSTINQIWSMNIWWVIAAFIFVILYWIVRSTAMCYIVKEENKNFKFSQALQLTLRTQFFNAITPFATGGQPFQIFYLNQCNLSVATSTGLVIENFIVYQIALVFLGIVAVLCNYFFHIFSQVDLLQKLVTLGFLINFLVITMLFVIAFAKRVNKKIISLGINILSKLKLVRDKEKRLKKWDKTINQFHSSATHLLENKEMFIITILLNLLGLIFLYLVPLLLFYAMGLYDRINVFETIITSSYVMLIGSFVPIPGGTGGLEYGFVAFFQTFVNGGALSAIMLVWRFITYYFGLIVGSISINIKRVK